MGGGKGKGKEDGKEKGGRQKQWENERRKEVGEVGMRKKGGKREKETQQKKKGWEIEGGMK